MPDTRPETLGSLVAAVADGARIHWNEGERATLRRTGEGTAGRLEMLTAPSGRASVRDELARSPVWPRAFVGAWAVVVGLAGLKVTVATGCFVAGIATAHLPAAWLPFAVNVVLFGLSGGLLIVGAPRDRRVRLLGAFFLFIAAPFSNALLPLTGTGLVGTSLAALRALPMDAFLPLSLWLFVRLFPSEPARSGPRRVADGFVLASALIGSLLFAANLWVSYGDAAALPGWAAALLHAIDRHRPALAYWPLLFALAIVALPYLVWKVRHETVEVRQRGAVFIFALVLGIAPMLVTVIATPFVPALHDPSRRLAVGWVLYGALLSIIPSTAYAVIVKRVMDVQFVLRKTSQHALARYVVWIASVGPLGYLLLSTFLSRGGTVPEVWTESTLLLLLPLLGFGALIFRERLLRGVDSWFLRGPVDYAEALARVEHGLRQARGVREIAATLAQEIERALHPDRIAVFVVDEERGAFVALAGAAPPLSTQSVIVDLLRQVRCGIQIHVDGEGPIGHLLTPEDREWLLMGRLTLMCPLVDSTGSLLGLMGIGESRGGLPYTKQDRMFITAISGHAAIQIENRRLQEFAGEGRPRTRQQQVVGIDWDNEPGAQCQTCWMVWPGNVRICSCHTITVPAALPFVVKGKFRVEKLIGSGGMGVVYQAVDMTLDRKVAIKTLPEVTPSRVALLQREARTMASVLHPNLALIFGVEQWRDTLLLIVEYLEGGTLADYLRQGVLEIPEVIDLGIVLADVLDRVHASGVLHRDIKPSNIAYTRDGIVKLLDFGVAAIVDRSMRDESLPPPAEGVRGFLSELAAGVRPLQTIASSTQHLVGTPLYLSPEAIAGHTPDASFDLWSLSLVLYETLTGVHPLNGASVAEVMTNIQTLRAPDVRDYRPSCPAELAALLGDCLSPHMVRRAASASELRLRLQRLRATLDSPA